MEDAGALAGVHLVPGNTLPFFGRATSRALGDELSLIFQINYAAEVRVSPALSTRVVAQFQSWAYGSG